MKCKQDGCNTIASFGIEGEKMQFCVKHKTSEMKSLIKRQTCNEEGCVKNAVYGYDYKKPLKCRNHKINDMQNVSSQICKHPDCNVVASYGIDRMEFCVKHKTNEMNYLNFKRKCKEKSCKKVPVWGYESKSHYSALSTNVECNEDYL